VSNKEMERMKRLDYSVSSEDENHLQELFQNCRRDRLEVWVYVGELY
jgi:hypothetical protein